MDDLNEVRLRGRLSSDPVLRYTPSGSSVANFGVATERTAQAPNGEQRKSTDFHNVVAWQRLGDLANEQLRKGSAVEVTGRLQTRTYEGQDGQKHRVTEVIAASIEPFELRTPARAANP